MFRDSPVPPSTPLFLAVCFGVSWTLAAALWLVPDRGVPSLVFRTALMVSFMFGPLIGAVVARRVAGQAVLRPLGVLPVTLNGWWVVAWLAPLPYAALATLVAVGLPGVEYASDLSGFFERVEGAVPPESLAEARAQLTAIPAPVFWALLTGQSLVAGATVNALAAFGEELGWRGFLFRQWQHLGFWRSSALIGALWGLWHAPLIVQGHNYPAHPVLGVGMMVVWCMLLAPPFQYIRIRTGSVIAAAVMHGTLNACAGLAILFLSGGTDLLVGVTGLAGFIALAVPNLMIRLLDPDPRP